MKVAVLWYIRWYGITATYKARLIHCIVMIQRIDKKTFTILPVILLVVAAVGQVGNLQIAKAWDGNWWGLGGGCGFGCGFHHWGWFHHFGSLGGCCGYNQEPIGGDSAYSAGISDAIWDHQNNLAYNPIGSCIPCHSQDYWNNFRQGYQHQWNSYTDTTITTAQRTSININGNNNYVNTNQQGPTLVDRIGQELCSLGVGCRPRPVE